jgi:hypothetical protein
LRIADANATYSVTGLVELRSQQRRRQAMRAFDEAHHGGRAAKPLATASGSDLMLKQKGGSKAAFTIHYQLLTIR